MQVFFMKNIRSWLIAGFIFTAVFGTFSHFFYGWSNENPLIGLISPVNESTWEHMKLVFPPVLLWSLLLPPHLILIFFISTAITFFCALKLQNSAKIYEKRTAIYFLTVLFLALFFLFTFLPPDIGLFAIP